MCSYKNIGHKDQFSPPPAFTVAPRKGRPTFAAYYPAARSSKQKHSSWRLGSALREKQIARAPGTARRTSPGRRLSKVHGQRNENFVYQVAGSPAATRRAPQKVLAHIQQKQKQTIIP